MKPRPAVGRRTARPKPTASPSRASTACHCPPAAKAVQRRAAAHRTIAAHGRITGSHLRGVKPLPITAGKKSTARTSPGKSKAVRAKKRAAHATVARISGTPALRGKIARHTKLAAAHCSCGGGSRPKSRASKPSTKKAARSSTQPRRRSKARA